MIEVPEETELAPDGATARQLAQLRRELAELAAAPEAPAAVEQLSAGLARVEKQFARAGKELFKANARRQTANASELSSQRSHAAEAEVARLREQLLGARQHARQIGGEQLAQALLPALDGLDEALVAGARLLEGAQTQPPGLWARLRGWFGAPVEPEQTSLENKVVSAEAARAWLEGAGLVRERLLETLANSQVRPILAQGEPFDPHRHHAVETVPSDAGHPVGSIVDERRRGYIIGDRVLRFAEVVVARDG